MTILDGLIEYWCMDEGPGASLSSGANGLFDLDLLRTNIDTLDTLPSPDGWWIEPGGERVIYNGGGVGEIPIGSRPSFANPGDGMTVAVRCWPEAGKLQSASTWPGSKGLTHAFFGMSGTYDLDPARSLGFSIECADNLVGTTPLWILIRIGTRFLYWILQGSDLPRNASAFVPFLMVVTIEKNEVVGERPPPDFETGIGATFSRNATASRNGIEAGNAAQQTPFLTGVGLAAGLSTALNPVSGFYTLADQQAALAGADQTNGEINGVPPGGLTVSGLQSAASQDWLTVTVYINGTAVGSFDYLSAAEVDTTRLNYGCVLPSVGGFGQSAYWDRVLSPAEILSLGDSLDFACAPDGCPAGLGTANPLLNPDGTVGIHPQFVNPLTEAVDVLASDGAHRHTRRVSEAKPRRYELVFVDADGDELARVREALAITRGGCVTTKWRHPIDDPAGGVCSAPDWLIRNGDDIQFVRKVGGRSVDFTLVLEQVENE